MLMRKLLSKISFFKKYYEKKDKIQHQKDIETIKRFKYLIEEKEYSLKELVDLKEILNRRKIDSTILDTSDMCAKVSFYSLSSHSAVESVRRKFYHLETIENCKTINLKAVTRNFDRWWSGIEITNYLIMFMSLMVDKAILLESGYNPYAANQEKSRQLSREEETYLTSILFRLMLSDFLTLLILILENEYDDTEQAGYE